MALYRCAACGSPNVVEDTQKEGYSYVKGAIGTVVLGAGGAVAGINGKTKKVYKCPDCGLTLNEPMPFEIKTLIDMGVMAPAARKNLQLNGVQIEWEVFTGKYKNIEKDSKSCVATAPASVPVSTHSPKSTETAQPTGETEQGKIVYKVAEIHYAQACKEWAEACMALKDQRKKEEKELADSQRIKLEAEINNDLDARVRAHTNKKEQYEAEKRAAEAKLASLGVFQLGAKSDTKKKIESLAQMIAGETRSIEEAKQQHKSEMGKVKDKVSKSISAASKKISSKYPLPAKPAKPKGMLDYAENGAKNAAAALANAMSQDEIFRYIEKQGQATFNEIKEKCSCSVGRTNTAILAWIDTLKADGEISELGKSYLVNYYPNIIYKANNPITEDELHIYGEYQREVEEAARKREQEKSEFEKILLPAMQGKGKMKLEDIQNSSPELSTYTTQKIFGYVEQLVKKGKIVKTTEMRRNYYEYK